MMIAFTKMHGLGNDFIVIDGRENMPALDEATIRRLCDRRFGIGCDQLVLLSAPTLAGADVGVRFFNPDGSEAGACGNASRCVAWLVGNAPTLQTPAGLLPTQQNGSLITVNMGKPRFESGDIPLSHACDTLHLPYRTQRPAPWATHMRLSSAISHAQRRSALPWKLTLFFQSARISVSQKSSLAHICVFASGSAVQALLWPAVPEHAPQSSMRYAEA